MTDQCLWCKADIESGDEVWIERQKANETEYEWSGVFCGDEHASLWVAKPFDPDPPSRPSDSWHDMAFAVGGFLTLVVMGLLIVVGLVTSIGWILDVVR